MCQCLANVSASVCVFGKVLGMFSGEAASRDLSLGRKCHSKYADCVCVCVCMLRVFPELVCHFEQERMLFVLPGIINLTCLR